MRWTLLLLIATSQAAAADTLDDYVELATGSFSTAAQAASDSRYDAVTWHIAEIWQDREDDGRWLYSESWIDGSERPYMQRLSRVSLAKDGSLLAERYILPDTASFVGAHRDTARFDALGIERLEKLEGCDGVLVRAGAKRFEGGTIGKRCGSRYKGASYAISHSTLRKDSMTNWDRGFNADGELVWGPAAGGYRFDRLDDVERCNKPVRMLVYGEIFDRAKFFAYVRAIADSGLYEKTGGYYEGITPPLEVFEGEPPPTRGVVISRFPCLEAAQAFWYSDEYEAIRPLRDGVSEFEVIVLPAPPLPEWVGD
ncbi:MAG: CpcT/CpeT family chromophore lyase [Pseudomonadota bacterium]